MIRNKPTMLLAITGPSATTPSARIVTDPAGGVAKEDAWEPGKQTTRHFSARPNAHQCPNDAGATLSVCRQQKKEKR